jgi:hypothetical protein
MAASFVIISALCTLLPARTPRQFTSVRTPSVNAAAALLGNSDAGQLAEVAAEDDRRAGHSSRLDDEQRGSHAI